MDNAHNSTTDNEPAKNPYYYLGLAPPSLPKGIIVQTKYRMKGNRVQQASHDFSTGTTYWNDIPVVSEDAPDVE